MSIDTVTKLAEAFAQARGYLVNKVEALQLEIDSAKRRKLPGIRVSVAKAAEAYDKLKAAIEAEPDLFIKPRTVVVAGIKVGLQKGKGKLQWTDDEYVVKKIKEHYDDQIGTLITVVEKPNKDALSQLPAAELKKLGITVTGTDDQVLIKPTDSDVDKLVNAWLKDATDEPDLDSAA